MVINHGDTGLVVLIENGRLGLGEAYFGEHVADPDNVFGALGRRDVFSFGGAEAHRTGGLGLTADEAVSQVHGVSVARTTFRLIDECGIRVCRQGNRPGSTAVVERVGSRGCQIPQDADGRTSVSHSRGLGVLARAADSGSHIRAGYGDPQERPNQREIGVLRLVK